MKKGILKLFLSILVFCTFLISGCEFNKSKTASTVTISVRTEFENMRSAIPTINIDEYTWSVSAKKSDGTEASPPSEPETSRLYFFNDITEGTWIFTVTGKKDGKTVFSGTKEIKIKNGTNYSETIFANYVDNSSDNGSIDLQIVLSEMGSFDINVYKDSIEKSNIVSLTNNEYGKKLSIPSIPQGDYDFYFEIKNGTTTICVIKQKICVRANVTTDRWIYSGEVYIIPKTENVALFTLTKKIIQNYVDTNIYVHGDGGTLSVPADGSTGNGSWNNPYTSLKAAFDKVKVLNDGVTPYTIWIDGEVVNNDTTSSGYLFSENSLGINLSILGLNGSNNKDVIDLNRRCGLISIDPEKAEDTVVPSVNIKNLTIINASAFYGSVIYNSNNGINAVIDNCYFKDNTATTNGGVFQFSASDGNLEISNSIFERNSAEFVGAISTAAPTTIQNCTFTRNHASFGGAINTENSDDVNHITLSGKVIAQDNYITEDENTLSNVWLNEFETNDNSEKLILANDFSDESCVGVTLNQTVTNISTNFTEGFKNTLAAKNGKTPGSIFSSDNSDYLVIFDSTNSEAVLKKIPPITFNFSTENIYKNEEVSEEYKKLIIKPICEEKELTKQELSSFEAKILKDENQKGNIINLLDSDFVLPFDSTLDDGDYNISVCAVYNGKIYSTDKKVYYGEVEKVNEGEKNSILLMNLINNKKPLIKCNFSKMDVSYTSRTEMNEDNFLNDSIYTPNKGKEGVYSGKSTAIFLINEGNIEIDGARGDDTNSEIYINSSLDRVFAISGENTTVTLKNLTISSTTDDQIFAVPGKAIYIDNGATVNLINCKIEKFFNASDGIIHVANGTLNITNCELVDNVFTSDACNAAALKIGADGKCKAENITVSGNDGQHLGAGIYNDGWLEIYDSTIVNNIAQRAAGIYSKGNHFYMKGTTLESNLANYGGCYTTAGGALWLASKDPNVENKIEDCKFISNKCSSASSSYGPEHTGGGAIYLENAKLTIENCTFNNNSSGKNGGAIQIYAPSEATVIPSITFTGTNTFTDNSITDSETYKGSVLYISSEVGARIDGITYSKGQYSDQWPLNMK